MSFKPDREVFRYEDALRSLGAHLDSENAGSACVLEMPHGFALRYRRSDTGALVMKEFRLNALPSWRSLRGLELVRPVRGRYQDFFRALGHELDDERATAILLDELDDAYLLSYQHLDPRNRYQPVKGSLILGHEEREMILEQSHSRRSFIDQPRAGLFAWLFGCVRRGIDKTGRGRAGPTSTLRPASIRLRSRRASPGTAAPASRRHPLRTPDTDKGACIRVTEQS